MSHTKDNSAGIGKHVRNYLSANVLSGVLAFATLSLLARVLNKDELGEFKIFEKSAVLLAIFFELNFRGALSRYYLERTDDFKDFLITILRFLPIFAIGCFALWSLVYKPIALYFGLAPALVLVMGINGFFRLPWNLNWKLLVSKELSGQYARLSVLRDVGLLTVVAAILFIIPASCWWKTSSDPMLRGVEGSLALGITAVSGAFAVFLGYSLFKEAKGGRFKKKHLSYALAFGVPLLPHAISKFAFDYADQLIIRQLLGSRETGVYAFAYDLASVMGVAVLSLNQAWLPKFTDLRTAGRYEDIERHSLKYALRVLAFALALVFMSREAILLLGSSKYLESLPIMTPVIFGYVLLFLYTLYANHSFFLRRTGWISCASVGAVVVNIVLNYWWIPIFGITAAAWSTLVTSLVLLLAHFTLAKYILKERVASFTRLISLFCVALGVGIAWTYLESFALAKMSSIFPGHGLVVWLVAKWGIASIAVVIWWSRRSLKKDNSS